ncbi:MAG: hypothetical protein EA001_15025 [Oscillatoriales cyanobacterium]|nr:MAG: hypothetical protein EA001_15025 [Oscillatoriales cyanobacterium]
MWAGQTLAGRLGANQTAQLRDAAILGLLGQFGTAVGLIIFQMELDCPKITPKLSYGNFTVLVLGDLLDFVSGLMGILTSKGFTGRSHSVLCDRLHPNGQWPQFATDVGDSVCSCAKLCDTIFLKPDPIR